MKFLLRANRRGDYLEGRDVSNIKKLEHSIRKYKILKFTKKRTSKNDGILSD